ncbi:SRPBCC family protein [Aeromicrobium sp.]|uniref:SRPBCC family protein n=1 Tax=Aeromicrobium sp. TaxID=1871063 RepID=UPI0019A91A87|nr:SRPBCC family protein [Aeromicrobium sp.]MBC7631891.1 SRPBCC family protein [Aeromicrobium sp.]
MPRIARRTFVAAPAHVVWSLAGDFAEWHPQLRIYADGPVASPELVVTVVSRDDEAMTLSYSMPDPPFPIANHKATIVVESAGHSTSHVTWSADFSTDPDLIQQLEDSLGDAVFVQALDKLATYAQDTFGSTQAAKGR